jgi:hypothetical protein
MQINVRGGVDGILLNGKCQVNFSAHMPAELIRSVKVGEKVKVRGVKPCSVDHVR